MLVLFVCTGNTCRSPMAEIYLEHRAAELGCAVSAASAGLCALPGSKMSVLAASALKKTGVYTQKYNIDVSGGELRAAVQVGEPHLAESDLVFGVTESHTARLKEIFPAYTDKISRLPIAVNDPFGGTAADYEYCLAHIKQAVDILFGSGRLGCGGLKIVPLDLNMLETVCEIEKNCFSEPWSEFVFRDIMQNSMYIGFAAFQDGVLAGFLLAYDFGFELQILNFAVAPHFRRKGIAFALLSHAAEYCKNSASESMTLEVRSKNAAAIALYSKFGFVPVGRRTGYYSNPSDDAILMDWKNCKPPDEKI